MHHLKALLLVAPALFAGVFGNIDFPFPKVLCAEGCPRGQICGTDRTCEKPPRSPPTLTLRSRLNRVERFGLLDRRQAYSTDGKCGPTNGNTICDPNSTVYKGACCSAAGWCGNTAAHCGSGCVSGCTTVSAAVPSATGGATTDGSCGRDNGGTTCKGWSTGECCSMYGWCGNSASHCGDGCQSGPCTGGTTPGPSTLPGSTAPGPSPAPMAPVPGSFQIIGQSGVPAMHAGLLQNGRVVFLDKVENYTQLKLGNGQYAYSSEYDPATNKVVALGYSTNAFCSGGTFLANGDFVSVGGNGPLTWLDPTVGDGFRGIRYLTRSASGSNNGQAWKEPGNKLSSNRWYPSVQTLADGRVFVASGSKNGLDPTKLENNNPTYEILSASGVSSGVSTNIDLLVKNQPYYMYPFMHLLKNGQLFIFTARSSIIFDINSNTVVKTLPDLPGDFRTYPNTGGSVLLPLMSANSWQSRVMICGGGSYQDITSPTDPSCGVIYPEAATPTWEMDSMPQGRGMVEGILLPDEKVLWLNGANHGAQGFLLAQDPTLSALLYDRSQPFGSRWSQLASSTIPRLYHSVALLLLDGTVMVAGSNPNEMPQLTSNSDHPFLTEFRVERYTPPYLVGAKAANRPTNVVIPNKTLGINASFQVRFDVPTTTTSLKVILYYGGFVTHSVHMGHRMMVLDKAGFKPGTVSQVMTLRTPPNKNIAPPGPYVIYVVANGTPSVGQFVQIV